MVPARPFFIGSDGWDRYSAQFGIAPEMDRLPAYRAITMPVLVIGFADDLVMPPHLGAEVAEAIPNGQYLEIAETGHLGFSEWSRAVNSTILDFLAHGP
jgi:pimeloyl-ACP methyl ester carboxylesterase